MPLSIDHVLVLVDKTLCKHMHNYSFLYYFQTFLHAVMQFVTNFLVLINN